MPDGPRDRRNPWTVLSATVRFENGWFRAVENAVVAPQGERTTYGTVQFKQHGVGVVAIDGRGRVILVGQFRFGADAYLWEVCKGSRSPAEPPLDAAARELREEAGVTARRWFALMSVRASPGLTDEHGSYFLACDLEDGETDPDPQERLALRRVPFAEALAMVDRGEITDLGTVAALLKVWRMAERGELPGEVAALVAPLL